MQFEVEPKESYYGTYTDDIITGSFVQGTRGLVGSVLSGSNEYQGETTYSAYYYKSQSQDYRSSQLRASKHTNSSKRIYDSIMPSFVEIYKTNGGKVVAPKWDEVLFVTWAIAL